MLSSDGLTVYKNGFEWRLIMLMQQMQELHQEIAALKEIRPATVSDTTLKREDDVLDAMWELEKEIAECYTVFDIYLDEFLESQQAAHPT